MGAVTKKKVGLMLIGLARCVSTVIGWNELARVAFARALEHLGLAPARLPARG